MPRGALRLTVSPTPVTYDQIQSFIRTSESLGAFETVVSFRIKARGGKMKVPVGSMPVARMPSSFSKPQKWPSAANTQGLTEWARSRTRQHCGIKHVFVRIVAAIALHRIQASAELSRPPEMRRSETGGRTNIR